MVVIRLARTGSKKRPFHSIVVTDSRNCRDGKFIEKLGSYNPTQNREKRQAKFSEKRVSYWLKRGARLSSTVEHLVKKCGRS